MIANKEILYQYPASYMEEKNHGKLLVSSSRLMWSDGKFFLPDYVASWDEISSVQTGKVKYCGIRVATYGSDKYVKFIIGPTNPTNLLILEELRRAIKLVRKHYSRNGPLAPGAPTTPEPEVDNSEFNIRREDWIRRYKSCDAFPYIPEEYEQEEEDNDKEVVVEVPVQQVPRPASMSNSLRHKPISERVRGNRISARITVCGGRRKSSDNMPAAPKDRTLEASPKLTEYIRRSMSSGETTSSSSEHQPRPTITTATSSSRSLQSEDSEVSEFSAVVRVKQEIAERQQKRMMLKFKRDEAAAASTVENLHGEEAAPIYNPYEEEDPPEEKEQDQNGDVVGVAQGVGMLPLSSDTHDASMDDSSAGNGESAISEARRRIEEKKKKRLDLLKRNESIRGNFDMGTTVASAVGEDKTARDFDAVEESPLSSSGGESALGFDDVKAMVTRQQDKRAALIRRRGRLV